MKLPCHAVCSTRWAQGLCMGSTAGWPPSSSLSAALSHAFLFICLLNGFGFGRYSLLCKQTVRIRLPCHHPTHTARVGSSGHTGPAPAEARSSSRSLSAEGIQVSDPKAPSALFLQVRGCTWAGGSAPGAAGLGGPWQGCQTAAPLCWEPGDCGAAHGHSLPRAGMITLALSKHCRLQARSGSV